MRRSSIRVIAAMIFLVCGVGALAFGSGFSQPAISLSEDAILEFRYPLGRLVHGWGFIANRSFTVTHLGLFDLGRDGFAIEHPIGLFRSRDHALLTQGVMTVGDSAFLRDGFRYVDSPDASIDAGEEYVLCIFTADDNGGTQDDGVVVRGDEAISPVITITKSGWYGIRSLGYPSRLYNAEGYPDLFGPSFLYSIPEPSAITVALVVFPTVVVCRRRE